MHALNILHQRGLRVIAEGDRLIVAPAEQIDDELRAFIREQKPELLDLLREWTKLEVAINACCDARMDSDEHRAALLEDCGRESPNDWGWFAAYFYDECSPKRKCLIANTTGLPISPVGATSSDRQWHGRREGAGLPCLHESGPRCD